MKKAFYTYWIAYLALMAVNLSGLTAPLWVAIIMKIGFYLTYIYLAGYPMYFMYIHEKNVNKLESKYLEAIIVSFGVRSLLWIFSSFGLSNRLDILAVFGGLMLGYYIFEVRLKINDIEKNLL